jgi:hypothetical protein
MSASTLPFDRIDIAINALGGLVNSVTRPALELTHINARK